jgi:hypothetical protein
VTGYHGVIWLHTCFQVPPCHYTNWYYAKLIDCEVLRIKSN